MRNWPRKSAQAPVPRRLLDTQGWPGRSRLRPRCLSVLYRHDSFSASVEGLLWFEQVGSSSCHTLGARARSVSRPVDRHNGQRTRSLRTPEREPARYPKSARDVDGMTVDSASRLDAAAPGHSRAALGALQRERDRRPVTPAIQRPAL